MFSFLPFLPVIHLFLNYLFLSSAATANYPLQKLICSRRICDVISPTISSQLHLKYITQNASYLYKKRINSTKLIRSKSNKDCLIVYRTDIDNDLRMGSIANVDWLASSESLAPLISSSGVSDLQALHFDLTKRWLYCYSLIIYLLNRFIMEGLPIVQFHYNTAQPAYLRSDIFSYPVSALFDVIDSENWPGRHKSSSSALKPKTSPIPGIVYSLIISGFISSTLRVRTRKWKSLIGRLYTSLIKLLRSGFFKQASHHFRHNTNQSTEYQSNMETIKGSGETILLIGDSVEIGILSTSISDANYLVLHSDNCPDGFNKSVEMLPDIIVCDISSINEQGYELCRKIKDTASTTHIPVILIAQRDDNFDELAGLKMGADAFLVKPISMLYVILQIYNLLNLSKNNRNNIASLAGYERVAAKYDNNQRIKLEEIVMSNLDDIEFRIPKFARLAGMSQMSLYSYIKELTGGTVAEFIKEIRLKKAAELLRSGGKNVTETAHLVGFEDRKYFSREFKKRFGTSPKEYSKNS